MFESSTNIEYLKTLAFNYRWATVPDGVIPLTAADSDMPVAPVITEAITAFAAKRYFPYAPPAGYGFFKESLARYYHEKYQATINPDWAFPTDSAAAAIQIACKSLLQPGNTAIILNPVDFLFKINIEAVGAKAVCWDIHDDPEAPLNWEALDSLYSSNCKLLCLCNPLNPTGRLFSQTELLRLFTWAHEKGIAVLSDEIWADITYGGSDFFTVARLPLQLVQRTYLISGYSKSFNLAGLRVGYIVAFSEAMAQKALLVSEHQSTVHGCNALGQVAAAAAMDEAKEWQLGYIAHLQEVRNIFHKGINACAGMSCFLSPSTFVLWVDVRESGRTAEQIQTYLLEQAKVAVVPGLPSFFGSGADGHIRISYSTSVPMAEEAIHRIQNAMQL